MGGDPTKPPFERAGLRVLRTPAHAESRPADSSAAAVESSPMDGTGNLPAVEQLDLKRIFDGVNGRVIRGEELTLAVVELDSGAIVPEHKHANEQLGLRARGHGHVHARRRDEEASAPAASGAFPAASCTRW